MGSQLISLITEPANVAATLSEQNIDPTNSERAPLKIIAHIGIAYVPYDVPRPFDASLAPIENAIIKLSINVSMHQTSISFYKFFNNKSIRKNIKIL